MSICQVASGFILLASQPRSIFAAGRSLSCPELFSGQAPRRRRSVSLSAFEAEHLDFEPGHGHYSCHLSFQLEKVS